MPLARHQRRVPGGPQHLGDRYAALTQVAAIAGQPVIFHHVADAGLVLVKARHERGTSGAAAGRVVELRQAQPALGQPVEMGRLDLASVAADVGETEIIGHDQNNVGTRGGVGFGAAGAAREGQSGRSAAQQVEEFSSIECRHGRS